MTHHDHGFPGTSADGIDWDERYTAEGQVWSGNPNGVLVAEATGLAPGTAVDVGCGEGADAIWLAAKGWDVTAFDVSSVALARAEDNAATAGVTVDLRRGSLLGGVVAGAQFDLVNVQYPALLHEDSRSIAALLDLVAPGGTLLFVHHSQTDSGHARESGFDPDDYVLPHNAHAELDEDWDVQVYEERARHVTEGAGAKHTVDLVLKARRAN